MSDLSPAFTVAQVREADFWRRVEFTDTCWTWRSTTGTHGYGLFSVAGKLQRVHRLAWEFTYRRPVKVGLFICHHCDNPLCVRPTHLFEGRAADNSGDMARKGRGSNQHKLKTHCVRGHELSGSNLKFVRGGRMCRACKKLTNSTYSKRRTARRRIYDERYPQRAHNA